MSQSAFDDFMHDAKRDFGEIFNRLRKVETSQAIAAERDKTLLDKMETLTQFFLKHDEAESHKYSQLENEVSKLTKLFYIASGIGLVLGFIGIDNLKLMFGG